MAAQHWCFSFEGALKQLARLAPRQHQELLRGMVAELAALTEPSERSRFAAGACLAIVRLSVVDWVPSARMTLACVSAGVLATLLDTHASGACLLVPLSSVAAVLCGLLAPRNAWRWAALLLVGLVVGSMVTPLAGFLDRADVLSLLPVLLTGVHIGPIACRWVSRTSPPVANI